MSLSVLIPNAQHPFEAARGKPVPVWAKVYLHALKLCVPEIMNSERNYIDDFYNKRVIQFMQMPRLAQAAKTQLKTFLNLSKSEDFVVDRRYYLPPGSKVKDIFRFFDLTLTDDDQRAIRLRQERRKKSAEKANTRKDGAKQKTELAGDDIHTENDEESSSEKPHHNKAEKSITNANFLPTAHLALENQKMDRQKVSQQQNQQPETPNTNNEKIPEFNLYYNADDEDYHTINDIRNYEDVSEAIEQEANFFLNVCSVQLNHAERMKQFADCTKKAISDLGKEHKLLKAKIDDLVGCNTQLKRENERLSEEIKINAKRERDTVEAFEAYKTEMKRLKTEAETHMKKASEDISSLKLENAALRGSLSALQKKWKNMEECFRS